MGRRRKTTINSVSESNTLNSNVKRTSKRSRITRQSGNCADPIDTFSDLQSCKIRKSDSSDSIRNTSDVNKKVRRVAKRNTLTHLSQTFTDPVIISDDSSGHAVNDFQDTTFQTDLLSQNWNCADPIDTFSGHQSCTTRTSVSSDSTRNTSDVNEKVTPAAKHKTLTQLSQNCTDPVIILDDSSSDHAVNDFKDTTFQTDLSQNCRDAVILLDNSSDNSVIEMVTTPHTDLPSGNSTETANSRPIHCDLSEVTKETTNDNESSSNAKKIENRRCFPTLNENELDISNVNTEECDSMFQSCQIYTSQVHKYREKKSKLESGLKNLDSLISSEDSDSSNDPVVCSSIPRKRSSPRNSPRKMRAPIPKTQEKLYSDLEKLISQHKEDQNMLDCSLIEDSPTLCTSPFPTKQKQTLLISVKCKTKIIVCRLESDEEFGKLLPQLSCCVDIPTERIKFFQKEELIRHSQTPADISFVPGTVIECLVLNDKVLNSVHMPSNVPSSTEEKNNTIEIKIQCGTDRQKLNLKCDKLQPLQKVLEEYASLKNLKPEQLTFKFDGEKIDPSESPDDVGMESGDCLDVIVQ